jgi:cytoskeletal protein CcmA (bactofilin family)
MVFNRKPDPKIAAIQPPKRTWAEHPATLPPNPPAGWASTAASPTESVIGSDLCIEGQSITIRCQGTLRVNGRIQADLHSMQLMVGEEALVGGSIVAETVEVYGKVEGAIRASRVVLHATAQVEGDIHSQCLSIEQGAYFEGKSRKLSDAQEIAPQAVTHANNGGAVLLPPPIQKS